MLSLLFPFEVHQLDLHLWTFEMEWSYFSGDGSWSNHSDWHVVEISLILDLPHGVSPFVYSRWISRHIHVYMYIYVNEKLLAQLKWLSINP